MLVSVIQYFIHKIWPNLNHAIQLYSVYFANMICMANVFSIHLQSQKNGVFKVKKSQL
jgi:hypothetical protein